MITYIKINGFKSFHNFEMEFTPLTVIAGVNAAGKSNLFDALRLLSNLADADKIHNAFRKEQRGEMLELFTQYDEENWAKEMQFVVDMLVNNRVKDAWGNEAELKYTRLRYELTIRRFENKNGMQDIEVASEKLVNLKHQEDPWVKLLPKATVEFWRPKVSEGRRGRPYIFTDIINDIPTVVVPQDGVKGGNKRSYPLVNASRTVLSSFDSVDFRHILAAKEEMKSWRFLQLNPDDLRQPTSKITGEDVINSTGKNLAAALYRIQQDDSYSLVEISRKLNSFLSNFVDVKIKDDVENKQYILSLIGEDGKEYTSRVLSEGTLRLLTLCILEQDAKHTGLLCFEEPENGIHPFRVNAMANLLKDLSTDFEDKEQPLRQVIVNTHSPLLVSQVIRWKNDNNVSLYFAEMRTRIINVGEKRYKIYASKIGSTKKDGQLMIDFSEPDRKLTVQAVIKYLQTLEQEGVHKDI